MEALEKNILKTVGSNLMNAVNSTGSLSTAEDLLNYIRYIRKTITDNVNIINTLVSDDKKPTQKKENESLTL